MGVHDGHRERTRERFLAMGLDGFADHGVLELLLFYALRRRDTNVIAHRLIDRFGSLAGVFDAPIEELKKVEDIGDNAATLLKLIPQISRRYQISRNSCEETLDSVKKIGDFIVPYFIGERDEVVYMVSLDGKCKALSCQLVFRGNLNFAQISICKLAERAFADNAHSVVIAHNHINGIALPSDDDILVTGRIKEALSAVDIILTDHLIVTDGDYISMRQSGYLDLKR